METGHWIGVVAIIVGAMVGFAIYYATQLNKLKQVNRYRGIIDAKAPKETYIKYIDSLLDWLDKIYGKHLLGPTSYFASVATALSYSFILVYISWLFGSSGAIGDTQLLFAGAVWSRWWFTSILISLSCVIALAFYWNDEINEEMAATISSLLGKNADSIITWVIARLAGTAMALMLWDIVADLNGWTIGIYWYGMVLAFSFLLNPLVAVALAVAVAVAVAVTVGVGVAVVVAVAVVVVVAVTVARAGALALAIAGVVAVTVTLAFAVAGAGAGVGVVIGVVIGTVFTAFFGVAALHILIETKFISGEKAAMATLPLALIITISIPVALSYSTAEVLSSDHLIIIFLIGLLPISNTFCDWLSLGVSRFFVRHIREEMGKPKVRWRCVAGHVLGDIAIAIIFLCLVVAIVTGYIEVINSTVMSVGTDAPFELESLIDKTYTNPFSADTWWISFMFLSTLLPTLIHFVVGMVSFYYATMGGCIKQKALYALDNVDTAKRVWPVAYLMVPWPIFMILSVAALGVIFWAFNLVGLPIGYRLQQVALWVIKII